VLARWRAWLLFVQLLLRKKAKACASRWRLSLCTTEWECACEVKVAFPKRVVAPKRFLRALAALAALLL
jgi:hypothetical protein